MEELSTYWPALFSLGEWKLMQIGLRKQLHADIDRRQLPISKKRLKRCLRTVSWCPDYLRRMVEDAPRYDLNGIVVGYVTAEQQAYAQAKLARSLSRMSREEKSVKEGLSSP
ncbi:ProQ/FINO family protein [Yersinia enterocolitica]